MEDGLPGKRNCMKTAFKTNFSIMRLLFGEKRLDMGEPLVDQYSDGLEYFDHKYRDSHTYIDSLVKRLKIDNSSIVSIGSGVGAEEILFSTLGNNFVDCIEPDGVSRKVNQHFINKFKVSRFQQLHDATVQSFHGVKKFDLIYSSSPSDWMHNDFREVIPENYLNFIDNFGGKNSFVVFKLYGGAFNRHVLQSNWFLKSLIKKLAKTRYKLLEYWISDSGLMSVMIASNFNSEVSKSNPIRGKERFGLKYELASSENMELTKYEEFAPYGIALKRFAELIKNKIV